MTAASVTRSRSIGWFTAMLSEARPNHSEEFYHLMPETADSEFTTVAKVGDIADGAGTAYAVQGRMVAVFNDGGTYQAIDDFCPHMGASLAGGHLQNGVVTCPWHAWRFSVCDGTWCDNPRVKIDAFEVRVVGDEIQVKVAKPVPPSPLPT